MGALASSTREWDNALANVGVCERELGLLPLDTGGRAHLLEAQSEYLQLSEFVLGLDLLKTCEPSRRVVDPRGIYCCT